MAVDKELIENCNLICQLQLNSSKEEADNKLSRKIIYFLNDIFDNSTQNTNKACHYLNDSMSAIVQERRCCSAILLGKEAVPLMVSLKHLGDSILDCDLKGCDTNTEQKLRTSLAKIEDNCHNLEDFLKTIRKSNEDLELVVAYLKRLHQEDLLGCGSDRVQETSATPLSLEISSFFERDIVASSPINQRNKGTSE